MALPSRHPDPTVPDISVYPEGEQKGVASLKHMWAAHTGVDLLRGLLAPEHLVAADLPVMRDQANRRDYLMPDLMVALDVGDLDPVYGVMRRQYRLWDEGKPPDLVIELDSPTTVWRDRVGKPADYARLGVREYVRFDPLGTMLEPRLQVDRLVGDRYEAVSAGKDGAVPCVVLAGYAWVRVGDLLRLRERRTRRLVPTPAEAAAAASARANREAARANREAARVQAVDLARLRAETRAATAEAELRRLQALLAGSRRTEDPDQDNA